MPESSIDPARLALPRHAKQDSAMSLNSKDFNLKRQFMKHRATEQQRNQDVTETDGLTKRVSL
jgi:hypothetical protein